MPHFTIPVTRIAPQTIELAIQADTITEARDKAVRQAPDLDFSEREKEAEYHIETDLRSLDGLWLVQGRGSGDDDDTTLVVSASSAALAEDKLIRAIHDVELGPDDPTPDDEDEVGDPRHFVLTVIPLAQAVADAP